MIEVFNQNSTVNEQNFSGNFILPLSKTNDYLLFTWIEYGCYDNDLPHLSSKSNGQLISKGFSDH